MRKGDKLEKDFSATLHKSYLPVLVSSKILRSLNAGQIDMAGLSKKNQSWVLSLFEVKSSQYPSAYQWRRLLRAQDYLSRVLEIDTKLEVKFCQKDEP
ncbi:MAG: hypothetical protein PHY93_19550 [Bacteriovorax sp.]|nr:hypothetical protein [Bacteriovorax sp.]